MSKSRLECNARCPAAGSIANALVKARYVLSSEFRLSSTSPIEGDTCDDLKRSWNKWWTSQLLVLKKERKRLKFEMAIKGCKRLFDKPCKRCDNPSTAKALTAWIKKMSTPHDFEVDPMLLKELQREVRKIVRGWGTRLKETRGALDSNPGHQGCLEVASGLGGGLATPQFGLIDDFGKCRLGSCKTKGKIRSVTMQSVYIKEKMRPIHNAIYDYLSTKDWLVRGDVSFSDFKAVCKGKDHIISGDYEGATDNIHSAAVNCIIDVLCEDENLTKKEIRILRGSFARPWWVHPYLGRGDIKRGSMMGNLVSFPLLCILNRACHIISVKRSGWLGSRVGRFNGDDCMFPGDKSLYDEWRKVTGGVGLIVNEEKTMFSNRFCELNSQAFDIVRDSLIGKISLNFFGLPRDSPGEILISTLDGIKPLKLSLQLEIVNRMMRYEISVRGAAIGSLSKFWQRQLIKRKWFRSLLDFGSAPVVKNKAESVLYPARLEGQYIYSERKLEMVPGPLPKDEYVDACDEICVMVEKEHIAHWRGVIVKPITESHDRKQHKRNQKGLRPNRNKVYTSIKHVWRYLWPKIVLDIVQDNFPDILRDKELYSREPVWNSSRISIKSIPSYYIKFRWNLPPPELALVPSYVRSNTDGGVKLEVL